MNEKNNITTQQASTNISKQIVTNAVELQGLNILQDAADSLRDERLSNVLLKNHAMMKWLETPNDTSYKEIARNIGLNSLKEDVKEAYKYALESLEIKNKE